MNLSEFLEKKLSDSNKTNNLVSDFIKDLQNHLENAELNIENGSKFVVTDINDDMVSLVNIENGDELKTSNFRKDDLINLDLGSNVIFKDNKFSLTNEEFEITNLNAKSKLDDLFFNIDEEEGSLFSVKKIDVNNYISWKEGYLQFASEPLSNILKRLSRYYDTPIDCDNSIAQLKCNGKLVLFDNIEDVMKTIYSTIPIQYSHEAGRILVRKK